MIDLSPALRQVRRLLVPIRREDLTFIAVDTETTGLDPTTAGVTEVGWQVVERGVLTVGEEFVVKPSRRNFVIDDHPRTRENAQRGQTMGVSMGLALGKLHQTGKKLREHTGMRPRLVWHNAPFDLMFLATDVAEGQGNLRWLLTEADGPFSRRPLDTQALIQPLVLRGQLKSSALSHLCETLGVRPGNHRAGEDARATAECLIELLTGGWV